MNCARKIVVIIALALPGMVSSARAADAPAVDPAAAQFFELKIRPMLADNCYQCHGPEKQKGELRLDSRAAAMKGGELGPVIVPGAPEKSLLIKAVSYKDEDLQMPPKKRLSEQQVAELTKWIKMGAPWPGGDSVPAVVEHKKGITDADRAWWAFQPIKRGPVPMVKNDKWAANPIDSFILAKLEGKGMSPNAPAERRELIRRAYYDLIGLPPSAEEIDAFIKDSSPGAYEKMIDELLARPQYGERWGRYWLDVVRFAQTHGYERDGETPLAWRFRDYVIKSFNEDKPYDRFVMEQLAGDELDDVTPDSIAATGYHRLGVWDDEPDDKRLADLEYLDDIIRTTSAAFLGMTVGCARCHDHKFDPMPQTDYYSMLACFNNIRPHSADKPSADAAIYMPLADRKSVAEWRSSVEARVAPLRVKMEALKAEPVTPALKKQREELGAQIKKIQEEKPPFEMTLAVRELGTTPRKTNLLVRGNLATPGAEVQPGFLAVLGGIKPVPAPRSQSQSTGLRRALAEWIVKPDHPLTARVMANRLWQYHFGRGIVRTPDDFGKTGFAPTHPELLDYLAGRFIDGGWSIKRMHKLIMLSSAYRMSSRAANESAMEADAGNEMYWRQNLRRHTAESLRDAILATSGTLNLKMGGRGFFPHLSGEVVAGGSRPGGGWEMSSAEEQCRRSVYMFIKRTMLAPMLEAFDFSNPSIPSGSRLETTVAPQSLMLLNDVFMHDQAEAMARRIGKEAGAEPRKQIERGYRLALGRNPTSAEMEISLTYLQRQTRAFDGLRTRVTFRPDVPTSLTGGYLNQLKPGDMTLGPRTGWKYGRGVWGGGYEGIMVMDAARGPFALYEPAKFTDAVIEGKMMLHSASELGSVILRALPAGDGMNGYEIALDPKAQTVTLRRHEGPMKALATATMRVTAGRWYAVKAELTGGKIQVWMDGKRLIDVVDPKPLAPAGHFGTRTLAAALSIEEMVIRAGAETHRIAGSTAPQWPADSALQSWCLLLMNLNEFVYVD